ncbi:thioesterase family protein [Profundibacterium mesophilum]|uniref:L-carnitine dehydrogenase n=1 Tax=Profundibacterium mesophilum KAUST100406-0324 TaxID=1037889 RepID=A0A921NVQ4_9RHOB|nr:thioesterase family protein [Profundibacterium mesophilum]KAF0677584.1 L-carnitine dehydrogenase [Profundibacterium mesophilum KAUST100406-0324]
MNEDDEARMQGAGPASPPQPYFDEAPDGRGPIDALLRTLERDIPDAWTDYNGHMNEARYLQAFGEATDRVQEIVGCDAGYIAAGNSFFTAETHIVHLGEAMAGGRISVETQILAATGPKLHLFHTMFEQERVLATGEQFLLHVSLATRRPAVPPPPVSERLTMLARAHEGLPRPRGAGRHVGQKPQRE